MSFFYIYRVSDPPVIRRELKADVAVKGKSAQLTCEADGNPSIKYEWYKVIHWLRAVTVYAVEVLSIR